MSTRRAAARRLALAAAVVASVVVPLSVMAAAAGGAPRVGAQSDPACATSGIDNWLDSQGNGAAGSVYYQLKFTNLSGRACTLVGYPGVSAVNLAGHQVGEAASRTAATAHVVTLAKGATATATLQVNDTGLFTPSACGAVTAAGFRVYAPNATNSDVIPFPVLTCSKTAVSLHISPVVAP